MDRPDIVYFDRYKKKTCSEEVYGDKFLRWTYGTRGGRLALAALVKRAWFSRWYGWRMDRPASRRKIGPFIEQYGLDTSEFARRPQDFESFNAFFCRVLRPAARPVDADPAAVVFPADGRHLCVPDLSRCDGLLVKGQMFDLPMLLDDAKLAQDYAGGSLLVSRLCPIDYHRFHFPVAGRAGPPQSLPGPLQSVNPIAIRQNIHILATNRRVRSCVESRSLGKVLLIEIGATCVGSIRQTYQAGGTVSKGDEKGYFRFGGSSTITLFPPGRVQFAEDLRANSAIQRELYAKMGDRMGTLV
jgi:phosphatidylserine decarboxylase